LRGAVLSALLIIAMAFWGRTPACGVPTVVAADLPTGVAGLSDVAECRISVSRRFLNRAGRACMIVLHEDGHLLGLLHSLDPGDIMYPVLRPTRWPCEW
jgi:hypothetical protein